MKLNSHLTLRLEILGILLILGAALALRMLAAQRVYFDSDEAIQGLMAIHITAGQEFPLMEYGSPHHGAAASYSIALIHRMLGKLDVVSLRIYFILVWLAASIPLFWMAQKHWGKPAAFFALAFYGYPPVSILEMSVKAWPGQAETQLILASLLVWIFPRREYDEYGRIIIRPYNRKLESEYSTRRLLMIGLALGLDIWLTPTALPAALLILGLLGVQLYPRSNFPHFLFSMAKPMAGVVIGYLPGIVYQITSSQESFFAFLTKSEPNLAPLSTLFSRLFVHGIPTFLGLQAQADFGWLYGMVGFILYGILLAGGMIESRKSSGNTYPRRFLPFAGLYSAVYILLLLLPRWNQTFNLSPRYLLPILPLVVLLTAAGFAGLQEKYGRWKRGFCLVFWLWIFLDYPSIILQTSVEADRNMTREIQSMNIQTLFSDYWTAYKITFLSQEAIIASPQAGPIAVDRYPRYTDIAFTSPSPAYLLFADALAGYRPAARLEDYLIRHSISFEKKNLGNQILFWNIQPKVLPNQTDLLRFGNPR